MPDPRGEVLLPDPRIGQVIDGRYRLLERVGAGGMGAVYRAIQAALVGREVAVKLLGSDLVTDASALLRFENEARIIGQLRHPNTLKLIDSGRLPEGGLYIVTEYLRGEPLDRLLMRGPLDTRSTLRFLRQIAESLEEAHGLGVIHRDLKPANVFIEQVGTQQIVKVLDFGIAKLVNAPGITAPLQVFGTPGYMAPEQAQAEAVDHRCDLYALGVIAYRCLAGNLPFPGDKPISLMIHTIQDPPTPLREHEPARGVGAGVESLIMQLLEKDPAKRPSSARELRERIDGLLGSPSAPASELYAESPPPALAPESLRSMTTDIAPTWRPSIGLTPAPSRRIAMIALLVLAAIALMARLSFWERAPSLEAPKVESSAPAKPGLLEPVPDPVPLPSAEVAPDNDSALTADPAPWVPAPQGQPSPLRTRAARKAKPSRVVPEGLYDETSR